VSLLCHSPLSQSPLRRKLKRDASLHLGRLIATPGALKAIEASGEGLSTYLVRHQSCDWGDVDVHDRKENRLSLEEEFGCLDDLGFAHSLDLAGLRNYLQ
jgi:hypothetical protein